MQIKAQSKKVVAPVQHTGQPGVTRKRSQNLWLDVLSQSLNHLVSGASFHIQILGREYKSKAI